MSGSTAKATRRQLRRAIGPDGLAAVTQMGADVYTGLAPAVEQHATTLSSHERQLTAAFERLERLEADAKAQRELSFWGRLHWALTGH